MHTSPESVLVSAVINSTDPFAAQAYGIRADQLIGYRTEYEWVQNYYHTYGETPSTEKLQIVFPEFPMSTDADCRWAATEIQEQYAHRTMSKALQKGGAALYSGDTRGAYEVFQDLRYSEVSIKPVNLLDDPLFFEDYDNPQEKRVPVPWSTLQGATGGIGPGELWYLASRPGMGKSAYLIQTAVEAAMAGLRVLFYSLEMTKRQVQVRSHAIMGHKLGWGDQIDAHAMLHYSYSQSSYKKLLVDIKGNMPGELHIHDASMGGVSPATILGRCDDYDLVIVDYIGLMRTDGGQRAIEDWRHAAIISNSLKEIVLSRKTRIMAASQINRDGDQLGWRPPKLKNMAQSDALGQDGDVVVTMKRYGGERSRAGVMSVQKNRHGEGGNFFWTNYLPNTGNFDEIPRDQADQIKDDNDED